MDWKGADACFCSSSPSFSATSTDSSLGRIGEGVDGEAEAGLGVCGAGVDGCE